MSDICDAREEENTFTQLKREPIFSEYLTDAREIMKQCWDVVGINQCVINDCLTISKDLGNR